MAKVRLTKTGLDVTIWIISGLILATVISVCFYLELNVIDSGKTEVVVNGDTYSKGEDRNGFLGVFAGVMGGVLAVIWASIGIKWLYNKAR